MNTSLSTATAAKLFFTCQQCGQELSCRKEAAAHKYRCPSCARMDFVPALKDAVQATEHRKSGAIPSGGLLRRTNPLFWWVAAKSEKSAGRVRSEQDLARSNPKEQVALSSSAEDGLQKRRHGVTINGERLAGEGNGKNGVNGNGRKGANGKNGNSKDGTNGSPKNGAQRKYGSNGMPQHGAKGTPVAVSLKTTVHGDQTKQNGNDPGREPKRPAKDERSLLEDLAANGFQVERVQPPK